MVQIPATWMNNTQMDLYSNIRHAYPNIFKFVLPASGQLDVYWLIYENGYLRFTKEEPWADAQKSDYDWNKSYYVTKTGWASFELHYYNYGKQESIAVGPTKNQLLVGDLTVALTTSGTKTDYLKFVDGGDPMTLTVKDGGFIDCQANDKSPIYRLGRYKYAEEDYYAVNGTSESIPEMVFIGAVSDYRHGIGGEVVVLGGDDIYSTAYSPSIKKTNVQPVQLSQTDQMILNGLVTNFSGNLQQNDLNRDDQIDRNEFIQILLRANTPIQQANETTNKIFQILDRNNNGSLDWSDITAYNQNPTSTNDTPVYNNQTMNNQVGLTEAERIIIQSMVNDFASNLSGSDLNRDGQIDRNELLQVLLRANTPIDIANRFTNNIFSVLDKNKNGVLDWNDIMIYKSGSSSTPVNQYQQPQNPQQIISNSNNSLTPGEQSILNGFVTNWNGTLAGTDLNRDGQIDRNELLQVLLRANTPLNIANGSVSKIFGLLDRDNNGVISLAEIQLYNQTKQQPIVQQPIVQQPIIQRQSLSTKTSYTPPIAKPCPQANQGPVTPLGNQVPSAIAVNAPLATLPPGSSVYPGVKCDNLYTVWKVPNRPYLYAQTPTTPSFKPILLIGGNNFQKVGW